MTISRLIAYAPFGASLGPLPQAEDYQAGFVFNDVGALTLKYPLDAAKATLLGSPIEVAVEVSQDNGLTWAEPPDARFIYLRDGRDRVQREGYAVECAGYAWMLTKALIAPTGLDANAQRTFTDATDGGILKALLDDAKARGWGSGFAYDFTALVDSDGDAWGPTQTISYDPGKSLLSVLQEMAELGRVTWRMEGRTLRVFRDNGTTNTNPMNTVQAGGHLAYGRDLTEAPFRRTWEGIAGTVFVVGDNATTVERTNAAAVQPWGRWEAYATASGVEDGPTLQLIGDGVLETSGDARAEHTFGVVFGESPYRPFRDYHLGHWINVLLDGTTAPESMRVRQITLTRDANGQFGGNLVLNDRFLEADVLAARRIAGLTGGASGGTGGIPSGMGPDILAPAQVTGLGATSAAYLDGAVPRSQVSLDWADVTTNADGTAANDVARYETYYRTTNNGTWQHGTTTAVSNSAMSGFTPGQYLEFRVRAVDTAGNEGAWSAAVTLNAAADEAPPAAPSTPTATARLGVIQVTWNGLTSTGAAMPADFSHVEVHLSTVTNFTPTAATLVDMIQPGGGVSVISGQTYNSTRYVRLIAVDRSGNKSGPSAQATVTVTSLVDTDIIGKILDGAQVKDGTIPGPAIAPKAITTERLAITAFDNLVLDPRFGLPVGQSWQTAAWVTVDAAGARDGGPALKFTNNATIQTVYNQPYDANQIEAGSTLRVYVPFKASVAVAAAQVRTGVRWQRADGTALFTFVDAPAAGAGVWSAAEGRITAPANTVSWTLFLQTVAALSTGTVHFDSPQVNRAAGGELIVDGAITTRTLAALAIEAGHIKANAVEFQHIKAGAVRATHLESDLVLTSRLIAGAAAGNRVEMTASGINAYGTGAGGAGTLNTVRIDAATGNATFLGELGTALPGEVGVFLYSNKFSYAGGQQTRPVVQFYTGATRDQPSIQASTVFNGLNLYSGADTGDREVAVNIYPGTFLVWIEETADSQSTGTYMELTDDALIASTRLGGMLIVGLDPSLKSRANRYNGSFESQFASAPLTGGDPWLRAAFTNDSGNMQGMRVNLGVSVRLGTGGPVEIVSGDGSAWRDVKARDFLVQSDRKMKENLGAPSRSALDVLRAAPTYEWEYRDPEDLDPSGRRRRRIGPMADDLPEVLLTEAGDGNPDHFAANTSMVDLHQLLATAIQALQELDLEMDAAPWRRAKPARKAIKV